MTRREPPPPGASPRSGMAALGGRAGAGTFNFGPQARPQGGSWLHAEALDLTTALDLLGAWAAARGGFNFPEAHIFGDAAGHARSVMVTRSCYDLIAAKLSTLRIPCRIRVPRGQPPIRDSLDSLNDALLGTDGVPRFLVHPRCVRLLTDFRELRRSTDGLIDKTDQRLSHSADAARYWCHFLRPAGAAELAQPMPEGQVFIRPCSWYTED